MRPFNHSASLATLVSVQIVSALSAQLLVLRHFGAGSMTDAYVASQAIPFLLSAVITVALQNVWQPKLSTSLGEAKWQHQLAIAQGQALLMFGGSACIIWLAIPAWSAALFPGLSPGELGLLYALTPILLLASMINCHASLNVTALRSQDRFVLPETIIACNEIFGLLALVYFLPKYGISAAAWTTLAKSLSLLTILQAVTGKPDIHPKLALKETSSLRSIYPLLLGSGIYKTAPLVDRYWSSQASSGSMTLFFLAQSSLGALAKVLDRAICQPETPRIARLWAAGATLELRSIYRQCLLKLALITAAAAICLLMSQPYALEAFSFGLNLSDDGSTRLWRLCFFLTPYLFASSAGAIVAGTFYAIGDTKTPVRLGLIAFFAGVIIKSICFLLAGIEGLAAGLSIYYLLSLLLSCGALERRLKAINGG